MASEIKKTSDLIKLINAYLADLVTNKLAVDAKQLTQHVRQLCFPLCISVYDDQMPLETSFRICLTSKSSKADYNLPIVRDANGLILAISQTADLWRCKCVVNPPGDFNHRIIDAKLSRFLAQDQYVVLPIYDGTIVTLYYYGGKWIMSSRNGCEMNNMVWRGHAYQRVFNHALGRYQTFDFAKLNPAKQYTIGFCHPAYHPAFQPGEFLEEHYEQSAFKSADAAQSPWRIEVWIVQTNDQDIDRLGLPKQHALPIRDLATMYKNNEQSTASATSGHMGYILRSKDPATTGSHSDIILRSKLFMKIRDAVYEIGNIGLPKPLYEKYAEHYRDINFAIILTFVNRERTKYLDLFPQYSERVKQIDQILNQVAKAISAGRVPADDNANQIHRYLCPIITADYKPSGQSSDLKIIMNRLMDVRYAVYYYEALCGAITSPVPASAIVLGDYIRPAASEYANPYVSAMATSAAAAAAPIDSSASVPGAHIRPPESYESNAIAVLRAAAK